MIKITAIAPYKEFADQFYDVFKDHNEYVHKREYEHEDYELEVIQAVGPDQIESLELNADVLVARGITAYYLRNMDYYIPIVEIPVAGNDLINCLYEMKNLYDCKEVAVIGTSNMIMGAESLSRIFDINVRTFILNDRDYPNFINDAVDAAVREGINAIIGGVRTIEYARKLGLNALLIKSGRESMWHAISEAKRIAYISRREQEKAQRFKTILDYAYEGVIAIDQKRIVSVMNSASEKILGLNRQSIIGKSLDNFTAKSKLRDILVSDKEYINEIIKHNDTQLAINKVNIALKGDNIGSVVTFQNATQIQEMEGKIREKIYTRGHVARHTFEDIIGESKRIKDVIRTAKKFSLVDSNVLITGETGTGKELFAQSIHNYSPRKDRPFVAVNCAALPENLLESELFGYVEGAFTGAAKGGKLGLFELAHRGTIFLDEISEISPKLQGRLLRVIQEKEIMRIGHDRVIPVDVRIISATNKDLYDLAQKGDFREDLYYRLDVLKLRLPSLDERKEDIPQLLDYFIKLYGLQFRKENIMITHKAKEILKGRIWKGNIRELRNICERLVVLSNFNVIDERDIERVLSDCYNIEKHPVHEEGHRTVENQSYIHEVKEFEKEKIKEVLARVGNNKVKAAQELGISRTTLWRRMKELGVR